jgi:hypothetical protein
MPTVELSDEELREHRRSATKADLSLPQRAGRAYAKLSRGEWSKVDHAVTPSGRTIYVLSVVRTQPDVKVLARVFLGMATREVKETQFPVHSSGS